MFEKLEECPECGTILTDFYYDMQVCPKKNGLCWWEGMNKYKKGEHNMEVDRIKNWQEFGMHMEEYLKHRVLGKYQREDNAPDLMAFTTKEICVWNILKYATRVFNGKGKQHDLEKIAHYAEMAWTMEQKEPL